MKQTPQEMTEADMEEAAQPSEKPGWITELYKGSTLQALSASGLPLVRGDSGKRTALRIRMYVKQEKAISRKTWRHIGTCDHCFWIQNENIKLPYFINTWQDVWHNYMNYIYWDNLTIDTDEITFMFPQFSLVQGRGIGTNKTTTCYINTNTFIWQHSCFRNNAKSFGVYNFHDKSNLHGNKYINMHCWKVFTFQL